MGQGRVVLTPQRREQNLRRWGKQSAFGEDKQFCLVKVQRFRTMESEMLKRWWEEIRKGTPYAGVFSVSYEHHIDGPNQLHVYL